MSSHSTVIDLPVSPLRSTAAEGNLLNAPVVATLMNGKTITGRLSSLDGPQAVLTLQSNETVRSIIRFSELRQLNFVRKYPARNGGHPLELHAADVSMPSAVEGFQVVFTDGRFLSGRTRGSFVDDVGLHLFQLLDSAYISRVFIPAQAVRNYHIGNRKLEIARKRTAPKPQVTASVSEQSPAMKRRKSDRKTSGMALNSIQLEQTFEQQPARPGNSLLGSRQIGSMLVEENVITSEQLAAALKSQQDDKASKLGEILVRMGAASANDIYRTLAHKFGLPFVLLRDFHIDLECLGLVPAEVAYKYSLIPLVTYKNRLVVAMDDPANTEAVTLLRFISRYNIEPVIATGEDISWALGNYYVSPRSAPPGIRPEPAVSATKAPDARKRRDHGSADAEKPIISFIDNTVLDAIRRGAVDIHVVPNRDYIELLFRIGGVLTPIRRFSKVLHPKVMNRLKIMGGMNVNESGRPQQGRTSMVSRDLVFDLRITVAPGAGGESAWIHLLNTNTRLRTIKDLGLSMRDGCVFAEALNKIYSLVLVTGPEGSGKSRTLYAALLALKSQNRSILTLEDPIRHHLGGIDQVQIDRRNSSAVDGVLKHMELRGTDVVMIGDIRDVETANSAIGTALNGHLVLGSLHARNATDALVALVRMGITPRKLRASLPCVAAQHALRLNCGHCMEIEDVKPEIRAALGVRSDEVFYRGKGCPKCNNTGYHGRKVIYELLETGPEIYALLESGASMAEIRRQAISSGMVPLTETALNEARMRAVSLTEAYLLHG